MQFKTIVRQEHLNGAGFLFGGYMLLWVDEYASIAAMENYPSGCFATRAMDTVSFTQSVPLASVLTFDINQIKTGYSSVTLSVDVTAMIFPSGERRHVFSTNVTMCNTDGKGQKAPLPPKAGE